MNTRKELLSLVSFVILLSLMSTLSSICGASLPAASPTDWPFGSRDLSRRGYAELESVLKPPLMLKWVQNITDSSRFPGIETMSLAAGRLFLGLDNFNASNAVACLDAETGRQIWTYIIPNSTAANDCTPGYYEGRIYAGGQVSNALFVLDADSGALLWSTGLDGSMYATSPIAVDGIAYVRGGSTLYAFDTATRSLKWKILGVYGNPAFYSDTLFIPGSWLPGGPILALDKVTGSQRWNKTIGVFSYDSPIVSGKSLFVGGLERGNYVLWALSVIDGSQIWMKSIESDYRIANLEVGFMAEANGMLYASLYNETTRQAEILAVNSSTGSTLWTFKRTALLFYPPTVANGVVYVTSYLEGKIYALSATSGDVLWEYKGLSSAYCQPIVSNGTLYFTEGGRVYAFTNPKYDVRILSSLTDLVVDGQPLPISSLPKTFTWTRDTNHTIALPVSATGFLIQKVFDHWVVDGQPFPSRELTVSVKGPMQIDAVWRDDYSQLIAIGAVAAILVIAGVVFVSRRKS